MQTNAEWREYALACLARVCTRMQEFTVNDVRDDMLASDIVIRDNRAIGGVFKTAYARGWITGTGRKIPSIVGHRVGIAIWKSKLYKNKKRKHV